MRKGIIIGVAVLGGLLTACGTPETKSAGTKTSSSAVKVAKATSNAGATTTKQATAQSNSQQAAVWNNAKSQQLASFMDSWGTTMGQDYDSYDETNNTDFYGLKYPAQLKNGHIVVNGSSASLAWSKTGAGTADYEVVAIYSDIENASDMDAHLYFFTLHQGNPVVLITQQNQGNPGNKVYFKTTANTDLSGGFSKIIAGQSTGTDSSDDSSQTTTSQTPKPYTVSSDMQGTWYSVDDDDQMSTVTFTDHTMIGVFNGEKPYKTTLYLSNNEDIMAKSNQHSDWSRVTPQTVHKDGAELVNIHGWNQTAGAGVYYGVKQEDVDGKSTDVLISAGGAGAWADSVYYRTAAMAKSQTTDRFDDIDYGDVSD